MADRPLRPATDHCLGEPLPHQQTNQTQAHPKVIAEAIFHPTPYGEGYYPVLGHLSVGYPELKGRLPTRYSPVRQCTCSRRNFLLRLACVKHAASVRPEPGSNSPLYVCLIVFFLSHSKFRLTLTHTLNFKKQMCPLLFGHSMKN